MTWAATAIVASTAFSTYQQKKAARKAEKQAKEDAAKAREAEVFAETTGEGVGATGKIDLSLDQNENTGQVRRVNRKQNLRI